MNNDLISRSALKKAIENLIGYSLSYEAILNAIDNAPIVEYPFYAEAYQTGYEEGQNITELHCDITKEQLLNSLRPQGKWIIKFDRLKCPFCGMEIDDEVHWLYSKEYNFNFCPNCGASLKGGAE